MVKLFQNILFIILIVNGLQGQQIPLFNHYADNISTINPAFISTNYSIDGYDMNFSVTHRSQWLDIPGAPTTQNIAGEFVLDKSNLILGGHIINDIAGPLRQTGVYGKAGVYFSGRNLEDGAFSGALAVGFNQFSIDGDQIVFRDNEPVIATQNLIYPDIGLGLAFFKRIEYGYFEGDVVYGGFSVPQVFNLRNTISSKADGKYQITRSRHMFGNIGYTKYYDNDSYLEISTLIRYVTGSKFHSDVNLKYKLNESLWLGFGVATKRALQINGGFVLYDVFIRNSAMKIGYTFTEYYNTNSVYFGSSHEITLSFSRSRKSRRYGF